ncbi:MAG: hypothetical protein ABEH56_04215 [Salinirussus sp.]
MRYHRAGIDFHVHPGWPGYLLIIEYETQTELAVYAECPDCTAVVHPT